VKFLVEFPEPELFTTPHQFAVFLSTRRFEATVQAAAVDAEGIGPVFTVKAPPTQEFVVTQA